MFGNVVLRQAFLQRGKPLMNVLYCPRRGLAKPDRCAKQPTGPFANGTDHADANDLPIPNGDFWEAYKSKNNKYTAVLISGILASLGAAFLLATKENFDMNFFVPKYPREGEEEEEALLKQQQEEEAAAAEAAAAAAAAEAEKQKKEAAAAEAAAKQETKKEC